MPYDPTTGRWVPTPTRVPGLDTDVIPTQYAPPPIQSRFTNADLPRAPLMGLSDAQKRAQQEQEVYERLQGIPLERSGEDILASARQTLAEGAPFDTALRMAARRERGDMPATSEEFTPEHETYRDVLNKTARWGQGVGFALSPVTGGASIPLMAGPASLYLAGDEALRAGQALGQGDLGDAGSNAALAALDALGSGSITKPLITKAASYLPPTQVGRLGLKQVPVEAVRRSVQASNFADEGLSRAAAGQKAGIPGAGQSSELAYATSSSPFSNVEHYYDARDLGMAGDKAAKVIGGRDKDAVEALRQLNLAGRQGRSSRFDRWADQNVEQHYPGRSGAFPELVPVGGENQFNMARGADPTNLLRSSYDDALQSEGGGVDILDLLRSYGRPHPANDPSKWRDPLK